MILNLIKMDLYRLFHSKAIKVGAIASIVVCGLSMLLNLGILEILKLTTIDSPEAAAGASLLFPVAAWLSGVDFADVVINSSGTFSLFISCMVAASFIGAEQSCGYVKNIAGQLSNRGYTVLSKFIVTSVVHLIILAIYTIVSSVLGVILFSGYINAYSIGGLIAGLCLKLLLYIAINAVILFLCTLTKSQSLAMVTGAIFGIGVTQIAYIAANALLGMMKISINVSDFMPDGINGALNLGSIGDIYIKGIIVSVVFITLFLGAAMILFKKRDVK